MEGSQMGSLGEGPMYGNSVPDATVQAGGYDDDSRLHNVSPVLDHAEVQEPDQLSNKEKPALTLPTTTFESNLHESWLSDDSPVLPISPAITPTPTPTSPAFAIADIHIPSRISSCSPAANKKRILLQRRLSSDKTPHIMSAAQDLQQPWGSDFSQTSSATPRSSHSTRGASTGQTTMRTSSESVRSYNTSAPSLATQGLAPLQHKENMEDVDRLSPLIEDDPRSFDLVGAPDENERKEYSLETRSLQLFSKEHLEAIFKDTTSLLRFTAFLNSARQASVPILNYYLNALKALQAIKYSNAIAETLDPIAGLEFTEIPTRYTMNAMLQEKAKNAFDLLVRNDLPAFITHIFIQFVSVSISKRITGNLPIMLQEASEGLAEVFCLTDPSRADNPIIFASEEFHRTTQYGVSYVIGRNCRFLQGPHTNRDSVARFKAATVAGKDHSELFLNYRRDGSPFMNLLMMAPLLDSRGNVRYFIGAQIDVSGLVKDCSDLEAFQNMLDQEEGLVEEPEPKSDFQQLSEMLDHTELGTVRKYGGNMLREHFDDTNDSGGGHGNTGQRVLIQDQSTMDVPTPEKPIARVDGRLSGPYKHYLLIRPAPSLRILFTSPSLRVPGILQSPFLSRIGGNQQVRESLANALSDGSRGVTAKIRWLPHAVTDLENSREEGRPRWIHCTPLLGSSGSVGVWMVVLVDEKERSLSLRRFRPAPPVPNDIRNMNLQPSRQDLRSRMDGADDEGFNHNAYTIHTNQNNNLNIPSIGMAYTPRISSLPKKERGAGRHTPLDTSRHPVNSRRAFGPHNLANPNSPRFPMMHDQLAVRSAASSVKDYYINNGSTPSLTGTAKSSFTSVAADDNDADARSVASGGVLAEMIAEVPEYFGDFDEGAAADSAPESSTNAGAGAGATRAARRKDSRPKTAPTKKENWWQRNPSHDAWPLAEMEG